MPIYEFKCKKCHHRFEELCAWDEISSMKCLQCKSKRVERLMSSGVVVTFTNPKGTSKECNFDYVAKSNYARAQQESAAARAANGGAYRNIDDTRRGMNYTI